MASKPVKKFESTEKITFADKKRQNPIRSTFHAIDKFFQLFKNYCVGMQILNHAWSRTKWKLTSNLQESA